MPGNWNARVIAGYFAAVLIGAALLVPQRGMASPYAALAAWSSQTGLGVTPSLIRSASQQWREAMAELTNSPPERNPLRGPNLRLSAALGPGSRALAEGLTWRIEKRGPDTKSKGELVWSGGGAEPELKLRPGQYYAEATYGLARNGMEFELPPDQTATPVVLLNAGTLVVHGAAKAGGPPIDGISFTLRKDQGEGRLKEVGRSTQPRAVFHVPAGRYTLTARQGLATVEMPVSISPGEERILEAVLNTGQVKLSAHAQKDGPSLSGATFFVFENGETGQHREILRSKMEEPSFDLPAGHYRVSAALGLARVEQDIRVEPGNTQRHHLVLDAGGVRLQSRLSGNTEMRPNRLLYRVFDLSAGPGAGNREIFTSNLDQPTIFLPKGKYRIESLYGFHNARQTKEIEVSPGEVANVDFELKTCDIKLRLVQRSGGQVLERVRWTLKYNGGGTVLISQDAEPSLILQPGSYQAIAQHETKTYSYSFDAVSSKSQVIEVVTE
jgi:hypothetical protein